VGALPAGGLRPAPGSLGRRPKRSRCCGLEPLEPENAIVYLITHPGHSGKDRHYRRRWQPPEKHSQQGWQILATVQVPGELALPIEKEILDWWRGELALPVHLGKPEMPHGGWTETVDSTEIDLAATIQRIKGLAAASH
jgi:hypothetical protein